MGGEIPKQYQNINGKPLLRHTVESVLHCAGVAAVCVVIHPQDEALYRSAVSGLPRLLEPVEGAATRQGSVYNGLHFLKKWGGEQKILIHDAARPFAGADLFGRVIAALDTHEAVTPRLPVCDTLRKNGKTIDRTGISAIQTPQGFHFDTIMNAHEELAKQGDFTDDAGMVLALGGKVQEVEGARTNFKITSPGDKDMAERMMEGQRETRTGIGFDVHRFSDAPARHVRLCGVDIPYNRKLEGHSDADVGLHAATDAILGAIGQGDIGIHFPPSDPKWKGADSMLFLKEAARMVRERGGRIIHIDITLICEAPKISPHRPAMVTAIASALHCAPGRISIKATTTEKLGFTGREEGIAAQAVATITLPVQDGWA